MIDPCRARQLTLADISGEPRLASSPWLKVAF